jgi:hypothetical protein
VYKSKVEHFWNINPKFFKGLTELNFEQKAFENGLNNMASYGQVFCGHIKIEIVQLKSFDFMTKNYCKDRK